MAKSKVKISLRGNCFEVRFSYGGKQLRLGLGLYDTPLGKNQASVIATTIERDILLGSFDPSKLKEYKPSHIEKCTNQEKVNELKIIKTIWEYYKENKTLEETTLKSHYYLVDRALTLFPGENPKNFSVSVSDYYSASVSFQIFRAIQTSIRFYKKWVDKSLNIDFSNEIEASRNKKEKSDRTKQAYTRVEARAIVDAFKSGDYAKSGVKDNDRYYARLVEFLFLTGCRIEDALALTWDDVKSDFIVFNKAFSNNVAKSTKNGKTRHFPLNDAIRVIVSSKSEYSRDFLVFPSRTGKHINLGSFRTRFWKRIVNGLVADGVIRRYLPPYNCRHTFISLCRDSGIPDAYIAQWCETSETMIVKHYSDTLSENYKPVTL